MARTTLRAYAWIFLAAGAAFVLVERRASLWLGLTGSLMCVLGLLAARLAEDPTQATAWDALLLSKGVSSALFLAFAFRWRQPLFLAAAAVDGAILLHLAWLRPRCEGVQEVWFARLSDARQGRAAWWRRAALPGRAKAACLLVVSDERTGVVARGWEEPLSAGGGWTSGRLDGAAAGARWRVAWTAGECPPFSLVPRWAAAAGLARAGYEDVAPAAAFTGELELDGTTWRFDGAGGNVGRIRARGAGRGWWWCHAPLVEDGRPRGAFELISAPGPLGARATAGALWLDGRLLLSTGPARAFFNRSARERDSWRFEVRFPGLAARGDCALGLAADVEHEQPGGRRLRCRNSKLSALTLELEGAAGRRAFSTREAALEFVEPA